MPLSASDLVQKYESGGGQNVFTRIPVPGGQQRGGSGIYQYIPSTWRSQATAAGVDVSQYPLAINAPIEVQKQVFASDFARNGFYNWTGNAAIMREVNAAGGSQAFTAFGDGTVPAGYSSNSTTASNPGTNGSLPYDPTNPATWNWYGGTNPYPAGTVYDPNTNTFKQPDGTTATPTPEQYAGVAGGAISDFYNRILNSLGDFFVRGGMVLAGIILLALAIWAMLHQAGYAPKPSLAAVRHEAQG